MKNNSNALVVIVAFILVTTFTIVMLWLLQSRFGIDLQWTALPFIGGAVVQLLDVTGKPTFYRNGQVVRTLLDLLPFGDRISAENRLSASRLGQRDMEPVFAIDYDDRLFTYDVSFVAVNIYRNMRLMGNFSIADRAALALAIHKLVANKNSRHFTHPGSMGGYSAYSDGTERKSYHNTAHWPVRCWVATGKHFTLHTSTGDKLVLEY